MRQRYVLSNMGGAGFGNRAYGIIDVDASPTVEIVAIIPAPHNQEFVTVIGTEVNVDEEAVDEKHLERARFLCSLLNRHEESSRARSAGPARKPLA